MIQKKKLKLIILDGYFQHQNILFTEDQRLNIFNSILKLKRTLITSIKDGSQTIGIHIRRADYISSESASKLFRKIPISYYIEALRRLSQERKILVFSDDPRVSSSVASEVGGIDVNKLKLALEDEFCLLMSCDDHVIANSTFSWWAAYLGYKSGGRIMSPKNWYHDMSRSQSNPLLLPHFELIDV